MLFALCLPAHAQQPGKIPRIGYVSGFGNPETPGLRAEAFRQGLRDLGHIEGKNILVEYRYYEGKTDRAPSLIAELVQLKVDVLVLGAGLPAVRAAKKATKTIPIVMVTTQDPVATGLIDSLARPGGNLTGLTTLQRELSGKRLEILKEAVPQISRVAALVNVIQLSEGTANDFQWYEAPARALKLELQPLPVRAPNPDFEGAFQTAAKWRANALITVRGGLLAPHTKRIADLAIKNRLPSMHEGSRGRRPHILYIRRSRELPARCHLRGQDSQGRQAGRPARRAADEVRAGDQSESGEADRINDSTQRFG
jgi:putative ABC transport system substrate-binding protein